MTSVMIPGPVQQEAQVFESISTDSIEKALAACEQAKAQPLYMPQLADARIAAGKDSYLWKNYFTTPSTRITGTSKSGNKVVVYAHVPTYLSTSVNLAKAREDGLVNGAAKIPQEEFYRILDLEDNKTVFVVDEATLRNAPPFYISKLSQVALKHPQTIPFLGGKERAEAYLAQHQTVYGEFILGPHYVDSADIPLGRVLFVGYDFRFGILDDHIFDKEYEYGYGDGARFLGVVAQQNQPLEEKV